MKSKVLQFGRCLLGVLLSLASEGGALGVQNGASDVDFFEKEVRPVLVERCYECHSVKTKTKGGLALDSRSATLKGGDTGAALVGGDPDKSLLIEAVRYQNHDLQMPPNKRLSDHEVKVLEDWVKSGAPDPRTDAAAAVRLKAVDVKQGRAHWSFKPLDRVEASGNTTTGTAIDQFIRAKLSDKGLSPALPADKHVLLRRATYDLTGLPPEPAEVAAFLADQSPEAFDKVIERLLASPQYGERWARHWLDVARYADSNGMDENVAFGNAWRYRDYVIRAFNEDKPYDQFIVEQLAGDLLPRTEDHLSATGFLALGARVLAEPDLKKLEMDIIDEQIDSLGKAFLGMTFGCARCHDHKFDPVTQEDYYAMAAIFKSTRSLSDEKMGAIKFWYEHSTASPEQLDQKKQHDVELKRRKDALAEFVSKAREGMALGMRQLAAEYLAAAVLLPENAGQPASSEIAKSAGLDPFVLFNCRIFLSKHKEDDLFRFWHLHAQKDDADAVREHYRGVFVEALLSRKGPAYDALIQKDGFLKLAVKDEDALGSDAFQKVTALKKEMSEWEAKAPELPALMGVTDSGTIAASLPVHIRGNHLTLEKPVERGFPEVMRTSFVKPIFPARHSGRLELARWIASAEHPLTARVMVNRVWRWHFGKGLVASVDNFGILGSSPSHPDLLDWLARAFVESGWSVKDLHRMIMKSAVYQQSSHVAETFGEHGDPRLIDPENRLLWRANIQRLEAEQIRDGMLSAAGWLDKTVGGKTIPLKNREFVFNHTSKDATTYETPRRALYVPIVRNHLYDMLEQFDYPDPTMPTGSRNSTVIAPQALIMLNAPVVKEASAKVARRLAGLENERERVRGMYLLLYSRPPSAEEESASLDLLSTFSRTEDPLRGWSLFCQTLMGANEFIYLR